MSTALAREYIEIEPGLKEQAESILEKIGMTYSQAVNLFTRQIVLRSSFPVELNAPVRKPLYIEDMTEDELDYFIDKGINDIDAGRTIPAEILRKEMAQNYGFKL